MLYTLISFGFCTVELSYNQSRGNLRQCPCTKDKQNVNLSSLTLQLLIHTSKRPTTLTASSSSTTPIYKPNNMAEGLKNPKQHRKMTKMLAKLWDAEGSEPFRDQHLLIRVGSRLDHQKYDKEGKRGWEKFAVELGRVYGRFLSR